MNFWRAQTDGESEALVLKALYEMARKANTP